MRKKKLLSVILASALLVTAMPFQAFAAPGAVGGGDSTSGDIGGGSTVGSSALLQTVVPSDLDFTINPLELNVNGDTNQIISTGYAFANKSNMDVQLTVTPEFVSADGVTIASSPDEITNDAGEEPTIYLELVPTTIEKPVLTKDAITNKFTLDTANTTFATAGGAGATPISPTGDSSMFFKLANLKAAYTSNGTDMLYDEDEATPLATDAIAFKFAGKVSQMSNWKDIDLGVSIKYDFAFITKETYGNNANDVAGAYGVISADATNSVPSIVLQSNGKFAMVGASAWTTGELHYMFSPTPITATKKQITDAYNDGSLMVGTTAIGKLKWPDNFDFEQTTKTGELSALSKNDVSGKYFNVIIPVTKGGVDAVAISNSVLMD